MVEREKNPVGAVYLSTNLVLFLGRHLRTAPHRHYSASVTISLDLPIRYRTLASDVWHETRGLAARPNAAFELDCGEAMVMNFQLDPEKAEVAALDALPFGEHELVSLPDATLDSSVTRDEPLIEKLRLLAAERRVCGTQMQRVTLAAIHSEPLKPRSFDPRITKVLRLLKESLPEAPSSGELAALVGLSEGRLIHLFGEQLGVPLRRYVLAMRLRRILFYLAAGHNLTDAAHEVGFCDSAHLARVYREMYGLRPSQMFRSETVRIRVEPPESQSVSSLEAEQDRQHVERFLSHLRERGEAVATSSYRAERRGAP